MSTLDKETSRRLCYAGARFLLDVLPAGEAIRTIESLMNMGIWCDEFVAILDCPPILREVSEPFDSCLRALGAQSKSIDQAFCFIIDYHTYEIITEWSEPCYALYLLFECDLRNYYLSGALDDRFLDADEALELRDLHKESDYFLEPYDDTWPSAEARNAALAEHQRRIIAAAKRWHARADE